MNILDIQNPKFLKKLKKKELEQLSTDIRQFLIEKVSKTEYQIKDGFISKEMLNEFNEIFKSCGLKIINT